MYFNRSNIILALSLFSVLIVTGCNNNVIEPEKEKELIPVKFDSWDADTSKNVTLALKASDEEPQSITDEKGIFYDASLFQDKNILDVLILTAPAGKDCTFKSEFGDDGKIDAIIVTCENTKQLEVNLIGLDAIKIATNESITLDLKIGSDEIIKASNDKKYTSVDWFKNKSSLQVDVSSTFAGVQCTYQGAKTIGVYSATFNIDAPTIDLNCVYNPKKFTIAGSATGITSPVELKFGEQIITVTADGTFEFEQGIISNTQYDVQPVSIPEFLACQLEDNTGIVTSANITNVKLTCNKNTYSIAGSATGISQSVTLRLGNETEADLELIEIKADGVFAFTKEIINANTYDVTIVSPPSELDCSLTNPSGTINKKNISNVELSCAKKTYSISGLVEGASSAGTLADGEFEIEFNGEILPILADGTFTFKTQVPAQTTYDVTINKTPKSLTCGLKFASGTVQANVNNMVISCSPLEFQISGTATGITNNVELLINDTEVTVTKEGEFTLLDKLLTGSIFNLSVVSAGDGKECTITPKSGLMREAAITNVALNCFDEFVPEPTLYLSGNAINISSNIELQLTTIFTNHTLITPEKITASGPFNFKFPISYNDEFKIEIINTPEAQSCEINTPTGNFSEDTNKNLTLTCVDDPFYVSIDTTGFPADLEVKAQLNNDPILVLSDDATSFKFPTEFTKEYEYKIELIDIPATHRCTISNATGTSNRKDTTKAISCELKPTSGVSILLDGLESELNVTLTHTSGATTVNKQVSTDANGYLKFDVDFQENDKYLVTFTDDKQPDEQQCELLNPSGTVTETGTGRYVDNIKISCTTFTYPVSGTIKNALGEFTLKEDGKIPLIFNAQNIESDTFALATEYRKGHAFTLEFAKHPNGKFCLFDNETQSISKIVGSEAITDISINCVADADNDQTPDDSDAFPNDPKESADKDNDGVGDASDAYLDNNKRWTNNDTDGDGVTDDIDLWPSDPKKHTDADKDGLSASEEKLLGTNDNSVDSDSDGMTDNFEVEKGLNPTDYLDAEIDEDGDGYTNLEEFNGNSDYKNAASTPNTVLASWLVPVISLILN